MFECLVGYPPFCSETTHETYQKIIHWLHHLIIPDDVHLSEEAEDLIRRCVLGADPDRVTAALNLLFTLFRYHHRLITSADRRLNVDQIKNHPFFYGVDWSTIRQIDAPFVPRLRSITDTSYFPVEDLEQGATDNSAGPDASDSSKDLAFLGYAFHTPFSDHFTVLTTLFVDIPSNASQSPTERSFIHHQFDYVAAGLPASQPDCPDLRVLIIASHTYS
jgi:protein-serine/threonine kinase